MCMATAPGARQVYIEIEHSMQLVSQLANQVTIEHLRRNVQEHQQRKYIDRDSSYYVPRWALQF